MRHIKVPQFHQSATIAQVTRVLVELYIDRMVPGTTFKFRAQSSNSKQFIADGRQRNRKNVDGADRAFCAHDDLALTHVTE